MGSREQAIKWFNEKDSYNKSELSHKYYKDSVSYNYTSLTGREIEAIWKCEQLNEAFEVDGLKIRVTPKIERKIYNNGFKTYYYKCDCCDSENIAEVPSGGFSPPNIVCNNCQKCLSNNPITIESVPNRENPVKENIYLNRLKEQYKIVVNSNMEDTIQIQTTRYLAMRLFCLDTKLTTFNEVELMENEINNLN
jgi:hypothetical protein